MVFKGLKDIDISNYFPWKISSSKMQTNILLMSKLFVILLLLNGFYFKINDPYLPFLTGFDFFNNYPGFFKNSLRFGFLLFSFMLFFNIKPKLSSFVLGIIIILTLLASKTLFRNHIFIVGCTLFLVGLSNNKGLPWLLIIQVSIVYIGASLNKALEMDWWTGQFMHNWLANALDNPIYNFIANILPHLWFAKILSWSSIFVELLIGIIILTKKWRLLGIWLMIIFHFAMFTMLAFRFGHFVEDLFILLLAFLVWPKGKIIIRYNESKSNWYLKIIKYLDWDMIFLWRKETGKMKNGIQAAEIDNQKNSLISSSYLLLYCEGFYVFLLIFDYITMKLMYAADPLLLKIVVHFVFCAVVWWIIIFFSPIDLKLNFHFSRYKKIK